MKNANEYNYNLMIYKTPSQRLNNLVYTDYFIRLMLVAKTLFKWENLPNNINEKWIERYLFSEGRCIFYKDSKLGLMIARMGESGMVNCYDEPTLVNPIATNYHYEGEQLINGKNCVIIGNNDEYFPTAPTIDLYARKLTNIDRTIDVNIEAQKSPVIIKCNEKQKLTMKQVFSQRKDNDPLIYADKNLDMTDVTVLNLDPPMVFKDLQLQKHMVYNECMTYLGVNNANLDKKERLVTSEVNANNDQLNVNEDIMLKTREHACKLINEMFGTNIKVSRRRIESDNFLPDENIENKEVTVNE